MRGRRDERESPRLSRLPSPSQRSATLLFGPRFDRRISVANYARRSFLWEVRP